MTRVFPLVFWFLFFHLMMNTSARAQLMGDQKSGLTIGYAGKSSTAGRNYNGLKLNLWSENYHYIRGVHLCLVQSGGKDPSKNNVIGLSAGLVAWNSRTFGASVFPFGDFQSRVDGFSASLLNSGRIRTGLTMSPLWIEVYGDYARGFLASGISLRAYRIAGFALAPLVYGFYKDFEKMELEMKGMVMSFIFFGSHLEGVGFSAVNFPRSFQGFCLGTLNVSQRGAGFQVGVVNRIRKEVGMKYVRKKEFYEDIKSKNWKLMQVGVYNNSDQLNTLQIGLVNWSNGRAFQFGLVNINPTNPKGTRVLPIFNLPINKLSNKDEGDFSME